MKYHIIADDRESDVNGELSKYPDIQLEVKRIENGVDGIWDKDWAWQRKRGDDLVSSIQDGRMRDIKAQQLLYPNLILIIEDKERAFVEGRLPEKAIFGAIASALIHKKVSVVYTRDFSQTALFIERMAFQLCEIDKNYPVVREKSPMTLAERQLFHLQGLYKCGPEIAIRLLAACKTPFEVYNQIGKTAIRYTPKGTPQFANESKITTIEKVGPTLVSKWREDLGI